MNRIVEEGTPMNERLYDKAWTDCTSNPMPMALENKQITCTNLIKYSQSCVFKLVGFDFMYNLDKVYF